VGERLVGVNRLPDARWAAPRRAVTFLLVVIGWVLFRSNGLGQAGDMLGAMASFDFAGLDPAVDAALRPQPLIAILIGLASVLLPRHVVLGRVVMDRWSTLPLLARGAVLAVLPYTAIVVAAGSFSPFLYFQF
jgi:alginate O-acetyltransferase complex protein AlgI